MTPTQEQLLRLPAEIQEQLLRIARLALGMDATEKNAGRRFVAGLALEAATHGPGDVIPATEMVAACGRIITTTDREATGLVRGVI